MMNKKFLLIILLVLLVAAAIGFSVQNGQFQRLVVPLTDTANLENEGGLDLTRPHALSIESLRSGTYPGSDIVIEETLSPGSNYLRYLTSYQSEGLKIYALLTVPRGTKPDAGWPVVIFNHGFIPPAEYRTTERYVAYTDGFSRNGYILFRPDYRGHGFSDGEPTGAYGSNDYTIDVLNAISSIKKYDTADPDRIGMWGHSMGGFITLRSMVVNPDIKAGVIWAGVVGSYTDMLNNWRRRTPTVTPSTTGGARRWRQALVEEFGTPEQNPAFWSSISANSFLTSLSGPIQLHHGTADASVPLAFSETLKEQVIKAGKTAELFVYPEDDHNLSNNFSTAMTRSVEFFDTYLKR